MPNDINELDVNDIGLKGIFGDRFHDETESKPTPTKSKEVSENTTTTAKVAQKPTRKPLGNLWEPPKPAPNWKDKLRECVKWTGIFGGLSLLVFYWQQEGLMAASIAVPTMCVCTALACWGIGKNVAGGER